MNFSQILVPTDLTDAPSHAFRHAAALARLFGGRVTALYVDEMARWVTRRSDDIIAHYDSWAANRVSDYFDVIRARFDSWSVPVKLEVVEGRAKSVIAEFAETNDVDLIVMPRRAKALPEVLAGSTTIRVLRLATVPVLVVPIGAADVASLPSYERVLIPTDLLQRNREAAEWALDFTHEIQARGALIHIGRLPELFSFVSADSSVRWQVDHRDERTKKRLAEWAEGLNVSPEDTHLRFDADPGLALASAATDLEADIVVLAATSKGRLARILLGGTTERLVKRSRAPILVLPDESLKRSPA